MFQPERLLGQLLQAGLAGGLGRGRRRNRKAGLLGGMGAGMKAQLGLGLIGVAMAAYEHYTRQKQTTSAPIPSPNPLTPSRVNVPPSTGAAPVESGANDQRTRDAMLLVQAMVAAAAADGVIDEAERAQMLRRASEAGFDDETKAFLEKELQHPKSLAAIVSSARPELATDLFAASCAAITADTEAERIYLDTLAKHLNITAEARQEIQRQLDLT